MAQDDKSPVGTLVTQTLPMPADTNANGDIFGGWLLSQMDIGGAILAGDISQSRTVTIAIDSMVFHKPVKVGDLVSCYASLLKMGRTSMTVKIEVWIRHHASEERLKVTEGVFTYVAVDRHGRPHPVKGRS